MPDRCVAFGCGKTTQDGVSLHSFPLSNSHVCAQWIRFVNTKRDHWKGPSKSSVLCSAHFTRDDFDWKYMHTMQIGYKKYLKKGAVPTIHSEIAKAPSSTTGKKRASSTASKTSASGIAGDDPSKAKAAKRKPESTASSQRKSRAVQKLAVNRMLKEHTSVESQHEVHVDEPSASHDLPTTSMDVDAPEVCQMPTSPVPGASTPTPSRHFMPRGIQCRIQPSRIPRRRKGVQVGPKQLRAFRSIGIQCDIKQGPWCSTPEKQGAGASHLVPMPGTPTSPIKGPDEEEEETEEDIPIDDDDDEYKPSEESFAEAEAEGYEAKRVPVMQHVSSNPYTEDKFIVFRSALEALFYACPACTAPCTVVFSTDQKKKFGTAVAVYQKCPEKDCGYRRTWCSQPYIGRMPAGNLILSAAILFSGSHFSKVQQLFKDMNVSCISRSTYDSYQNKYLFPTVLNSWENDRNQLLSKLAQMDGGLILAGDGRADTPGHSAKYGSYTMLELRLNKVVDVQLVQSNEVKSSSHMELEGLIRSVTGFWYHECAIDMMITDRHTSIQRWIREEMPNTKHFYDVWHVAKGVGKKVDTLAKQPDCEAVADWRRSIVYHVYWSAGSTPDGDGEVMSAKWESLTNHVANIHEGHSDQFPRCQHKRIRRRRKWLKPGTKAYEKLADLINNRYLVRDIKRLSPLHQTSSVEAFHSTILHFAPKHTHFSYKGMLCRLYLAAMHFNENSERGAAKGRDGQARMTVVFPKAKKGEPSVRQPRTAPTYNYVSRLMTKLVEEVTTNPKRLMESIQDLVIPPPLSHKYADVDRHAAVESYVSRFALHPRPGEGSSSTCN